MRDVEDVVLVVRTYPIRVGGNSGPLLDEIDWDFVTRASGSATPIIEYTTVTKRVRRVGRFDLNQVVRAAFINSATQIALTFADYIDCSNSRMTRRDHLTPSALEFIAHLEAQTDVPVTLVSTGPDRMDVVDLRLSRLQADE